MGLGAASNWRPSSSTTPRRRGSRRTRSGRLRSSGNFVWDGLDRGIYVTGGASPPGADNTITTKALGAIHVDADAHPQIGQNVVGPGLTTRYLDRFRSGS
jgi:hypothetical protein